MSYLCTFILDLLGCSDPCSLHIFGHMSIFLYLLYLLSTWFGHVVFFFENLQVMCLHDEEWAPVLFFHKKEPVSHLPTRHSMGSCFARPFLLHF